MMVTLLVYSYSVGVFSSRKIALACERNLAFRAIVGKDRPDFRSINDFRSNHLGAMKSLFLSVLQVAGSLGMVHLGNLSTDGSKIEANASRHKAMSYKYMLKDLQRLEQEIEQLLKQAANVDAEQARRDAAQAERDAAGNLIPIPNTADSGYFSEDNVRDVTEKETKCHPLFRFGSPGGTILRGIGPGDRDRWRQRQTPKRSSSC